MARNDRHRLVPIGRVHLIESPLFTFTLLFLILQGTVIGMVKAKDEDGDPLWWSIEEEVPHL
jgi:hypothetical protein